MIVTIDGPAGAGKSTVATRLAGRLGFAVLDTGALYRAVTFAVDAAGVPFTDTGAVIELARRLSIELDGSRVRLDGRDVTDAIRTPAVSRAIFHVADLSEVRDHLSAQQRRIAATGDFVTEGRDQGTVVFPTADVKVFLTASATARASRRLAELRERGQDLTLAQVQTEVEERDRRDRSRPVGALKQADDAHVVNTDGLTIEDVVNSLVKLVASQQPRSTDLPK